MIGAAATLGGVTRMTVSLVVIMFELTGGLTYIVPIMIAVMISKWVGDAIISDGIYDGHIHLYGYPFLDSKREFTHNTLACDVMKPRRNDAPLSIVDLSTVTVGVLQDLVSETDYFGFPCVLDSTSQLLAGFLTRKDITFVLDQVTHRREGTTRESRIFFIDSTRRVNQQLLESTVPSVNFRGLMDPSPFQISDQTPMETVVEMFRKMGLRQVLVSHNGRLLGIITKKDVLRHIAERDRKDPTTIRFN
jgi:chloride channel 3/4/5